MGKVQNLQLISLDKIPELKAQTIQLIESEFGYVNPNSFEIDFAPLHTTNNLQNCWILYDEKNQKVIAHIGLLPQKIFIRNQEYPIIFLGGIVVGKQHRGKGLFTILMRHIIEKYSRSCAFFLLWSDKQELYKKFNFFSAIAQIESIPQNNFNYFLKKHNFVKTIFRDLSYKEKSQIKKLYNKKIKSECIGLIRDEYSWSGINQITSSDLFIKKNNQNNIEYYFFMNKGQDLPGIIHEFAGESNLPHIDEDLLNSAKVWTALANLPKIESYHLQTLGLMRIGSSSIFKSFIHNWSGNKIKIVFADEKEIKYQVKEKLISEKIEMFVQKIFGPNVDSKFHSFGPSLFVHGLDSI